MPRIELPAAIALLLSNPACGGSEPGSSPEGTDSDPAEDSGSPGGESGSADSIDEGLDSSGDSSSACGDGRIDEDEACDDGPENGSYGACAADCSGAGPHCGDGEVQVDGGETCDDGNRAEADGCSPTCVASGTVVWTFEQAPVGGVAYEAYDIVALRDGRVVLAGHQREGQLELPVLIVGTSEGRGNIFPASDLFQPASYPSAYYSARVRGDGTIMAVGTGENAVFDVPSPIRTVFDPSSNETSDLGLYDFDAPEAPEGTTVAVLPDDAQLYCDTENGLRFESAFALPSPGQWFTYDIPCATVTNDVDDFVIVTTQGISSLDRFLERVSPAGTITLLSTFQHLGEVPYAHALAIAEGGDIVIAGGSKTSAGPMKNMLRRHDALGAVVWEALAEQQADSEWYDVAIDPAGNIVVVGQLLSDLATVATYDAEGELVWQQELEWGGAAAHGVAIAPNGTIYIGGTRAHADGPGAFAVAVTP